LENVTGKFRKFGPRFTTSHASNTKYTTFYLSTLKVCFCCVYHVSVMRIVVHLAFLPEPVYRGPELITYFRGPNLEVS